MTVLMNAAGDGDKSAGDRLLPLVYEQLRRAAELRLAAERVGHMQHAHQKGISHRDNRVRGILARFESVDHRVSDEPASSRASNRPHRAGHVLRGQQTPESR